MRNCYVRLSSFVLGLASSAGTIDVEKSLGSYRLYSAHRCVRVPDCTRGALSIRQFVLNPEGIWQDNCFMRIHCSAAKSALDLAKQLGRRVLTAPRCAGLCSTQFVLPNRNIMSNTREAGLVQIAISQVTAQLAGSRADPLSQLGRARSS